jgi:hypothetical protein
MGAFKHFVMCSQSAILARSKGENCHKGIPIAGNFMPSLPRAARSCPILRPPEEAKASLRLEPRTAWTCIRYGRALLAKLIAAADTAGDVRDHALLLKGVLSRSTGLAARAVRYDMLLGNPEDARSLMLTTSPNDPQFLLVILKLALIGRTGGEESMELATAKLMALGFFDDAVDIALIAGRWDFAVQQMLTVNHLPEAA